MFLTLNTLEIPISLIFTLVFNFWLIRIYQFNLLIFLIVIATSIFVYLSVQFENKRFLFVALFFITLSMFFQFKTSSINSLTFLNEMEKIGQEERTRGYPRPLYRFANWLELRREAVMFYKIQGNFAEVVDPNLYFFANHPRERVGIVEYEKFPYIFLPFFIWGLLRVAKKSNVTTLIFLFSPIILLSLIGNSNPIGPFSLFPAIATYTAIGLNPVFSNKKNLIIFLLVFSLVYIQTFSYATY